MRVTPNPFVESRKLVRAPLRGLASLRFVLSAGAILGTVPVSGRPLEPGDWPQLLGPERNGVYTGGDVAPEWPAPGPPVVWKVKVGSGYSGPVVAGSRLILFHRQGSEELVECLDAASGGKLWAFSSPTDYRDLFGFDDGPRATPTIAGGRVYTLGAAGALHAIDLETGTLVWRYDTRTKFDSTGSFFGVACSPLVEEELVLVNVGIEKKSAILALDTKSGKVAWSLEDHEASYSSPAVATIGKRRMVFFFTRAGLVVVDPKRGVVSARFPWRARMRNSVNAATPLVIGERLFLSECYGPGAVLLNIGDKGVEEVWSADRVLSNHYVTSVHRDGHLYGLDGRQEAGPHLRCVELKSGKPVWTRQRFGTGSVILAGPDLLILTEGGELVRIAASPEAFAEKQRATILASTARALPALAGGRLYARDENELVCVDLRGQSPK